MNNLIEDIKELLRGIDQTENESDAPTMGNRRK